MTLNGHRQQATSRPRNLESTPWKSIFPQLLYCDEMSLGGDNAGDGATRWWGVPLSFRNRFNVRVAPRIVKNLVTGHLFRLEFWRGLADFPSLVQYWVLHDMRRDRWGNWRFIGRWSRAGELSWRGWNNISSEAVTREAINGNGLGFSSRPCWCTIPSGSLSIYHAWPRGMIKMGLCKEQERKHNFELRASSAHRLLWLLLLILNEKDVLVMRVL